MQDGCFTYFQDWEKNVTELAMATFGLNKISVFILEMSKLLKKHFPPSFISPACVLR